MLLTFFFLFCQLAGSSKPTASGTLSNLLQSGKNSIALTSGASSTRTSSASSILLTTTNSSANTVTSSASTPSKGRLQLSNQLLNNLSET